MSVVKKNILLLIPSLSSVGGAETLVHSLSALLSLKHNVTQATFDSPHSPRRLESCTPFYALGRGVPRLPFVLSWITFAMLAFRLSVLKRELGTDMTISVIWRADLINVLSRGRDLRVSLGVINILHNPVNRLLVRLKWPVGIIYRSFDRVLAISSPLRSEFKELFNVRDNRLGTFRNFLVAPDPHPVWVKDKVNRYIFCGRLAQEKNLEGLLHVWAGFASSRKNIQLVVLGDGPLLSCSKEIAQELGLVLGEDPSDSMASVLFLGMVDKPEDYLTCSYALLLPSREEGAPTVLILALMLGIPIFAADSISGGVKDMLATEGLHVGPWGREIMMGMLLPVPDISIPSTLSAWIDALRGIDANVDNRNRWAAGAIKMGEIFSHKSALEAWTAELNLAWPPQCQA